MEVARYLVQGADVWLNTPRRPREASGTSGMKAVANGVLHLSTLDGWWAEAWDFGIRNSDFGLRQTPQSAIPFGWAIGRGETYDDPGYQDRVEAEALYDLLERDVVPLFYDRGADGLPRRWIARMKASIRSLCHFFNTHRMLEEYTERFYVPAADRYRLLAADGMARTRALAEWRARVQANWPQVHIEAVDARMAGELQVGADFQVRARVYLGDLTPDDVVVELYLGLVDSGGEIMEPQVIPMQAVEQEGEGRYAYQVNAVSCRRSGRHGYTVRVLPYHLDLPTRFLPGLITWAGGH
jgi:starch phosphorylase